MRILEVHKVHFFAERTKKKITKCVKKFEAMIWEMKSLSFPSTLNFLTPGLLAQNTRTRARTT